MKIVKREEREPTTFEEALRFAGYGMPSKQRELARECRVSWETVLIWKRKPLKRVKVETEQIVVRLAPRLGMEPEDLLLLLRKQRPDGYQEKDKHAETDTARLEDRAQ